MADASPFASLGDLMAEWSNDVLHGKPPVRWAAGAGPLARFPLGPGLVALIGGPPATGKTAFANQLVFDAVRLNPELKALVTCCEMPPPVLLDRQLSRLSGVPYARIRERGLTEADLPAVNTALATLNKIRDRLAFHVGPFDLSAVAEAADGCDADLIVVDYLQRLGASGQHRDKRSQTNAVLDALRQFASAGRGLLVLSSVGRQPNKNGKSTYDGLTLASFKESGDIEYAADDAYILVPPEDGYTTLKHVKARHTEAADIVLRTDLPYMRFDPADSAPPAAAQGELLAKARDLFSKGKTKHKKKGDAS
jgi:replicative DNA helicase